MSALALAFVAALLAACGGARRTMPIDQDALLPSERPTLQMYLVLTSDPKAMQGPGAVDAMWDAVHGRNPQYASIHARLHGVPGGYEVDVELDFADLPHPLLPAESLAGLLADLPPEARAKAEKATFAVSVRSQAPPLPGGGQIRLAGTAALFAADQHDGIVLDLLARRAWTPTQWSAELSRPELSAAQVRLMRRAQDDGRSMLLTRGNPKYGAPDLQMRDISEARISAARARFVKAQSVLIREGGAPGRFIELREGAFELGPCVGVPVEVSCASVPPPE